MMISEAPSCVWIPGLGALDLNPIDSLIPVLLPYHSTDFEPPRKHGIGSATTWSGMGLKYRER